MTNALTDAVRRALVRDTTLTLAQDAEEMMIVVRDRDRETSLVDDETSLFRLAVDRYLRQTTTDDLGSSARPDQDWSFRSHGYDHAATILRFCRQMGMSFDAPREIEGLYEAALGELRPPDGGPLALDRHAEVTVTYRLVRSLRTAGRLDEAFRLSATLPPEFFFGSGAESRFADIQFETGACLLEKGRAAQVFTALGELEQTYWEATEARTFSTRHRHGYILALADQSLGRLDEAIGRMEAAREHLARYRVTDTRHDVYELSLTLTLAELLATAGTQVDRALTLAESALDLTERIRGRWGVIARARTPLSRAFRRVYGDVALLAAGLPGRRAARLGLRVCLSAKQTGFASHMRANELQLAGPLRGLIRDVIRAEQAEPGLTSGPDALREHREWQEQKLEMLRRRIERAVTPMLAYTVLPVPADLSELLHEIGDRHALDFCGLPDTLTPEAADPEVNWFRTLIRPDDAVLFERFAPGEHLTRYFKGGNGQEPWLTRLTAEDDEDEDDEEPADRPDWQGLAVEVLPVDLLRRLRAATDDDPIELLVSAHRELSLLPWVALEVDAQGTQLLRRAVVTHTPVLTCVSTPHPPPVSGPALVRLVSLAEEGVWVEEECAAWDLGPSEDRIVLSHCSLDGRPPQAASPTRISDALSGPGADWGFLHIATHGAGTGLDQYLYLPEEDETAGQLPAAYALALRWPESTLMASCHVGRLINIEDAEPLSFVMAVLTGGGRCVVAAIDTVLDLPAGRMAGRLAQIVRAGGVRLDRALRQAQLERLDEHVTSWALFNAYVR